MSGRGLKWLTDIFGGEADGDETERSLDPIYPTPDGKPIKISAADVTKLLPIKNWSHPFKQKNKVNVIERLTQLANATAGYYPLGAGGLWHGGIHFDSGTAGVLDQSSVVCIADGEVVAYRTDMNSAVTSYVGNKKPAPKPFSRNFVLVRHRLEAPRIPGGNETPPSLIIYSLYMHLEDGAIYQGAPELPRPHFWDMKEDYLVPMTAKDADRSLPGKLGLNVRHQEKRGAVIDLLPQGTLLRISGEGEYRRLISTKGPARRLVGTDGALRGYVRFDQLEPIEGGEYRAKAGLVIYGEKNAKGGDRKYDLPKGSQVKVSGEGELRKLESVAQFVHFESLQALPVPRAYDEICVLDKPLPIRAGALIGHIGQYQDYAADLPERKLHLEVFSDGDVGRFIAQCRNWEKGLPVKDKTLLKLAKGTAVVGHKDHFGEMRPPTLNDESQLSSADLFLPESLLDGLPSTHKILIPEAGEREACNWYRLEGLLNDEKNQLLDGWVRVEKGGDQWTSPWAWEGYDVITDYTSPPEFMAASLRSLKRLTDEQIRRYGPMADAGDKGPIKKRLFDLIGSGKDKKITVEELRAVMRIPAHAQALSRLIIYCESEWYYRPEKWDVLDEILGHAGSTPHLNWLAEKDRINQLSWWSGVFDELGLPADGAVSHFHFVGLVGCFMDVKRHPEILIDNARVRLEFLDLYDGSEIEEEDYVEAAATLGCEVEAIKAVALTETGSVGSYFAGAEGDKVAAILFERHYFHQLTGGQFDQTDPDISYSKSGGYGLVSEQYGKLIRAYNLSASEALKSASWGRFQIMGRYHINAGYSSVEAFVRDMNRSEKNHLKAFVSFIKSSNALSSAIVQKNWLKFALVYNGPRQKGYDEKMRKNYDALKGM
ncbi:N-acetylmuramidase family protein [Pseudomonas sp. DE0010]|uniref:N-acetylmuramidase family protein n=1 Tax=Pseudomonas sp. DE0010 TaxID=2584951 RepID=UPI001C49A7F5|nr:N-acetylmuramidase family protein [Pseudomonas sp. DE0010]